MRSDPDALHQLGTEVLRHLIDYIERSRAEKSAVVELDRQAPIKDKLQLSRRISDGFRDNDDIVDFLSTYLEYSMHLHDPRYMGHQVAVPHLICGLAELVHGVANQPMSIYEMGPAANLIEHHVVQWMLDKIGWTTGQGVLTHGGSLANMHCLLAARAAAAPSAWSEGNPQNLVVLAPESSHYSIARAVGMMGMGQQSIVPLKTDKFEVVKPIAVENAITDARHEGKNIMAVVVNTCATGTGLYDPVNAVAEICNKHGVWLHLDSPHGITALLSENLSHLLNGIEKADSLIWDAHKMMRTSSLCTGALFKSKDSYQKTFSQKASYLIHEKETAAMDFIPYQIECTKAGLGPKLFWVLASEGEQAIADFVEQTYRLAEMAYDFFTNRDGFHCPYRPQSNILCFTYRKETIDQLALREKIVATGQHYISSTEIKGQRHLRLVIMNEGTTMETIKELAAHIEHLA